jgi:phenylacetate-CoA ligase
MGGFSDRVYKHAPVWMQNVGISAFGLMWNRRRFGGVFQSTREQFKSRESLSAEEWSNYQTKRLRVLLEHSHSTVPYYREKWKGLGIAPAEINHASLNDLSNLPTLPKSDIRDNPDSFISEKTKRKKLHTYLTSGTTGTPLAIKFTTQMHQTWSAAYEVRCRTWAGVDRSMSRAMIGGRLVVPDGVSRPPYWRYNRVERQLYLSAFHISPSTASDYAEAINKYQPQYLVGYASSYYFLGRMILEQGIDVCKPLAILTSSEKLTDEMRATMQEAFSCDVYDGYSGLEACCLASECEHHRLHVSPDVGIIELLDDDGRRVPNGQPGEIVATGLLNFAQPLIRYRTGDVAVVSDESCPCGRSMPVLTELVGRLEDTVIGADGREMVRFHGIFVGLPHVREGQIIQESIKRFKLRLVVTDEFNREDEEVIAARFEERLGPVKLQFEFVDEIERTERGKFRAVISKVKRR